jgi:hypothetical protein
MLQQLIDATSVIGPGPSVRSSVERRVPVETLIVTLTFIGGAR